MVTPHMNGVRYNKPIQQSFHVMVAEIRDCSMTKQVIIKLEIKNLKFLEDLIGPKR